MNYNHLKVKAESLGLEVVENYRFKNKGTKGMIVGNRIALSYGLTDTERYCVLAEEIMHSKYNTGNILNSRKTHCRKQETIARNRTYERLVPIKKLVQVLLELGDTANAKNIALSLNTTERFLKEAVIHYRRKYGVFTEVGNYVLCLDPVKIMTEEEIYYEDPFNEC